MSKIHKNNIASYAHDSLGMYYIVGLVQDSSNSIANAMELLLSCAKSSTYNPHLATHEALLQWSSLNHVLMPDNQANLANHSFTTHNWWLAANRKKLRLLGDSILIDS